MTKLTDPALPGLGLALDPAALTELLSQHLPECREGATLSSAQAIDVQYTPGEGASVLVRLKFHEGPTRRTTRQLLCVRVLREDQAAPQCPPELLARYDARRASKEGQRESPLRTAWLPIPERHLLVQAFPLDPGLPTLLDLTDPETLRVAFGRLWSPRKVRVRRVRVDTLAYTPESRAALAYEILAEDRDTAMPHQRRLVGKLHVRRSPARLFAGAWAVWRRSAGRVNIPPPVGFIESLGLSLQEFVQGVRLSDLAGKGSFVKPVRQAARAIAHVHAQHLPLHAERDLGKEAAVVRRWLGVLDGILPERREEIARLGAGLLAALSERFTPRGTVHADFHLANILVHRDAVTIVDWDQVAHGDPMLDVGRLLASLRVSALRTKGDAAGLADVADAFLETYLEASGDDERRARLFEASALLIAAAAPFRLQREGWKEQAHVLLDETWRCFEKSARGELVAVPEVAAALPFAQRLAWATDPVFSLALVGPVVRKAHAPSLDIVECRPRIVHEAETAFEVEYQLKGFMGRERWRGRVMACADRDHGGRGVLRRLEALRAALGASPDAPRLPVPLGQAAPLLLAVMEPAPGERLEKSLAGPDALRVVEALAFGLAAIARAPSDGIDKDRPIEKDLRGAHHRVEDLVEAGSPVAPRAAGLLERVERLVASDTTPPAPALRDLRLGDLTCDDGRIGLAVVRDVSLAHPLVGVGAFVGRLHAWGLEHERQDVPRAFHAAWLDASQTSAAAFAPFESLGLLRAACHAARREEGAPAAMALLEMAEDRLRG